MPSWCWSNQCEHQAWKHTPWKTNLSLHKKKKISFSASPQFYLIPTPCAVRVAVNSTHSCSMTHKAIVTSQMLWYTELSLLLRISTTQVSKRSPNHKLFPIKNCSFSVCHFCSGRMARARMARARMARARIRNTLEALPKRGKNKKCCCVPSLPRRAT